MAKRKATRQLRDSGSSTPTTAILLTAAEAQLLVRIAEYHLKALGPMRLFIRFSAPADIRSRYRFVAEESMWLHRFAEATYEELSSSQEAAASVPFTLGSLVAFWGRLLASLNTPRSRRRLSESEIEQREALCTKLEAAVRALWRKNPNRVEQALRTRRTAEAQWMWEKLRG